MKCDDCLNFLEVYVDGEANDREAEQIPLHLATCATCSAEFDALTADKELYARYDRELEISPALWNGIATRIAAEDRQVAAESRQGFGAKLVALFGLSSLRFAMPVAALVLIALMIGLAYWRTRPQPSPPQDVATTREATAPPVKTTTTGAVPATVAQRPENELVARANPPATIVPAKFNRPVAVIRAADNQSDVYDKASDVDERETASHLEQAQQLLTSFRNLQLSDDDTEVDVSYERAESRRLLSENIVLRREAENAGKYPTKSVLGSLEPFLIDIANLPEKAKPSDVREITARVERTEIVAELRSY